MDVIVEVISGSLRSISLITLALIILTRKKSKLLLKDHVSSDRNLFFFLDIALQKIRHLAFWGMLVHPLF